MNIKLEKLIYTLFIISILTLTEAQSGKKKNVLLIVGDDLGWSDFGFFDPSIQTPNIDRLVKTGILLNNTYTSAVCTPSRNSILSGVYPEHTGLQHDVIMPEQPVGLPTSFKLLPKYFKENGYKTHMIGKWHLGFCKKEYTPVARGFDTFYGYFNAQEDYYSHRVSSLLVLKTQDGLDFWNQTEDYIVPVLNKNNTYSMFTYRDRAFDILEKHDKKNPFFMYFSSQNCHLPNQVPKEYEDRYSFIKDDDRRKYLGMVTLLDDVIGNLTTKLDDLGLLENTLIFFISDNGGAVYSSGRNYPLRGGKLSAFEGGHRVRAFVNGPGLKPNTYNGLFHSTDLLPTILNAAISEGIQISGIDGINQWPNIVNDQESNRTSFIYIIDPLGYAGCDFIFKSDAIREGDWKLILGCPGIYDQWYPEPTFDETFVRNYYSKKLVKNRNVNKIPHGTYLFNIKDDPLEKNNLADVHKDIVKDLTNKLDSYKKKVVYPVNPPTLLPDPRANPNHWHDTWSPGWC